MRTALYVIWCLVPAFFFLMWLWASLEKFSNKEKKEKPGDYFKQTLFVGACVAVAVLIDQYLLEDLVAAIDIELLPLGLFQVLLLPVVMWLAALALGPTKPMLVSGSGLANKNQAKRRRKR